MTVKRAGVLGLLLIVACSSAPAIVYAQSAQIEERVAASFVLALGRTPTAAEVEQWAKDGPRAVADLFSRHRERLRNDSAAARAVAMKASQDAFGIAAVEEGLTSVSAGELYAEIVQRHIQRLDGNPAEYERVVNRAYRLHLQRDAYAVELEYWKARPTTSFVLLAACVENWARRNQPGLMATAGVPAVSVNSPYLAAVRLSPGVAAEARAAAGLPPPGDAALAAALGRHVVAPGADTLASVGGIHFAAAGAADLVPAPPGRYRRQRASRFGRVSLGQAVHVHTSLSWVRAATQTSIAWPSSRRDRRPRAAFRRQVATTATAVKRSIASARDAGAHARPAASGPAGIP